MNCVFPADLTKTDIQCEASDIKLVWHVMSEANAGIDREKHTHTQRARERESWQQSHSNPSRCNTIQYKLQRYKNNSPEIQWPHLDGVDQRHEAEAAEVDVQGVAQRPHQVVPGRAFAIRTTTATSTHVHHRGASRLAGRLAVAVGERGAVRGVVVRVVIHI